MQMQMYIHAHVRWCTGAFMHRYFQALVGSCRDTSKHLYFHAQIWSCMYMHVHARAARFFWWEYSILPPRLFQLFHAKSKLFHNYSTWMNDLGTGITVWTVNFLVSEEKNLCLNLIYLYILWTDSKQYIIHTVLGIKAVKVALYF